MARKRLTVEQRKLIRFQSAYNYECVHEAMIHLHNEYRLGDTELLVSAPEVHEVLEQVTGRTLHIQQVRVAIHNLIRNGVVNIHSRGMYLFNGDDNVFHNSVR